MLPSGDKCSNESHGACIDGVAGRGDYSAAAGGLQTLTITSQNSVSLILSFRLLYFFYYFFYLTTSFSYGLQICNLEA